MDRDETAAKVYRSPSPRIKTRSRRIVYSRVDWNLQINKKYDDQPTQLFFMFSSVFLLWWFWPFRPIVLKSFFAKCSITERMLMYSYYYHQKQHQQQRKYASLWLTWFEVEIFFKTSRPHRGAISFFCWCFFYLFGPGPVNAEIYNSIVQHFHMSTSWVFQSRRVCVAI